MCVCSTNHPSTSKTNPELWFAVSSFSVVYSSPLDPNRPNRLNVLWFAFCASPDCLSSNHRPRRYAQRLLDVRRMADVVRVLHPGLAYWLHVLNRSLTVVLLLPLATIRPVERREAILRTVWLALVALRIDHYIFSLSSYSCPLSFLFVRCCCCVEFQREISRWIYSYKFSDDFLIQIFRWFFDTIFQVNVFFDEISGIFNEIFNRIRWNLTKSTRWRISWGVSWRSQVWMMRKEENKIR